MTNVAGKEPLLIDFKFESRDLNKPDFRDFVDIVIRVFVVSEAQLK